MNATGKLECIFCSKCSERIGWMENPTHFLIVQVP